VRLNTGAYVAALSIAGANERRERAFVPSCFVSFQARMLLLAGSEGLGPTARSPLVSSPLLAPNQTRTSLWKGSLVPSDGGGASTGWNSSYTSWSLT